MKKVVPAVVLGLILSCSVRAADFTITTDTPTSFAGSFSALQVNSGSQYDFAFDYGTYWNAHVFLDYQDPFNDFETTATLSIQHKVSSTDLYYYVDLAENQIWGDDLPSFSTIINVTISYQSTLASIAGAISINEIPAITPFSGPTPAPAVPDVGSTHSLLALGLIPLFGLFRSRRRDLAQTE